VVIAYIRANDLANAIEAKYELSKRRDKPLISIVTQAESLAMSNNLGWGQAKRERLNQQLSELVIMDISSPDLVDSYAYLRTLLKKAGKTIQHNDIWIASLCRVAGAHLITTDSDFQWLATEIKLHLVDISTGTPVFPD
jgi:predicted nucleic acid-binding protein